MEHILGITPDTMQDLAHQAPTLVLYAISGFAVLKMFLSHLKTEGLATRKVLLTLSTGLQANTVALAGLTEVIRGLRK